MIFGIVILISALALSAIAAYYSVLGLLAIFAAGGVSIIALGGILEWCKIVATIWLHQNWHRAGWKFKTGFVFFIAGLMFLTSMGIFGYLSKGHIDQGLVGGDVSAQLSIFDEKIRTQRENIESARRALTQMDAAVDQILGRSTSEEGARRSAQLRRNQKAERQQLQRDIDQAQREITRLNEERAPIAAKVRRVEAEVGPIKYIAAMVYGDDAGTEVLERAVRWVIVLIVSVFDPLALTLILAANKQFEWSRRETKSSARHQDEQSSTDSATDDSATDDSATDDSATDDSATDDSAAQDPNPDTPGVITKPFTSQEIQILDQMPVPEHQELELVPIEDPAPVDTVSWQGTSAHSSAPDSLATPHLARLERAELDLSLTNEENQKLRGIIEEKDQQLLEQLEYLRDLEQKVESLIISGKTINNIAPSGPVPKVGFGTIFPNDPVKGDMFVRVDSVPTSLYKYSGRKWIEIDKTITDTYAYNDQYIKHLINRLDNGEYSVDDLTEAEKYQIDEYLTRSQTNK